MYPLFPTPGEEGIFRLSLLPMRRFFVAAFLGAVTRQIFFAAFGVTMFRIIQYEDMVGDSSPPRLGIRVQFPEL